MQVKNHKYQQLELKDDYEGKVEATFISANSNTNKRPSVLYVHGFIDYFFHPHLSAFFDENGFDFYAIELRKYGHSMLPHQHKNYCRSMEEYLEDMDAAILKIKMENSEKIVLLGHSTGGLITSLYLNKGNQKNLITAMVLNSPFLETNVPSFARIILKPVTGFLGSVMKFAKLDGMLAPIYPSSVHKDYEGEWEFNLEMKPIEGFPVYFALSRAVMDAQDELMANSNIKQPILLMHSHDSYLPKKHEPRVFKADIVLNVEHMKAIGPGLGNDVTMKEIQDGMHDLFLSPKPVREKAMNEMMNWLKERV
jgi:alpha-beta hydrolase superfamily lysophospholipase